MSMDKATSLAEHLLSLIEKKNVWDLDILSSIIDIDPTALSNFIKTLPMAYGLSIYGKKVSITPELVVDAKEEIKNHFINWHQNTEPNSFSKTQAQKSDVTKGVSTVRLVTDEQPKVKITVYGDNFLVQKVIDKYFSKEGAQAEYQFVGGYEPIHFDKTIGNDVFSCQMSIIDYKRDLVSLAPLLFELAEGILFIFEPLDLHQVSKMKKTVDFLKTKRETDIFVTFLAILKNDDSEKLNEIANTLTEIIFITEDASNFQVSFAILSDPEHIKRKINDLIQTSHALLSSTK